MKPIRLIAAAFGLTLLASCSTTNRDYVYLQDMQPGNTYAVQSLPNPQIQPNDRINIRIDSKIPTLAEPFNLPAEQAAEGYLVDHNGDIQMPIIGKVHVQGLTTEEVQNQIAALLLAGNYLKDAMVNVNYKGFTYSVLGAVNSKGNFKVPGERITLIEAIAQAGDLANNAMTDRVCVIREEKDGRKIYVHDLKSSDIFTSPAYYLKQNDIVYVEPKYQNKDREQRAWQFTTLGISLAGVITTIIWACKK